MDFKAEIYNRQIEKFKKLSFEKLIKDREFRLYLGSLGYFSGDPKNIFGTDYDEGSYRTTYWTNTRWRIERFKNKSYILSPAFYDDKDLQARFAIRFEKDELELKVYAETPEKKQILSKIGCYKILIEYSILGEKLETKKIQLSPWDQLSITISNLDAFFWEQTPVFESFDLNIIHQAFQILIDKKFISPELLNIRCNEILEIINELIKDEEMYHPQIYIQIKALIDYADIEGDWFEKLYKKFNLIDYLYEIYHKEDEEVKFKISYLIEKNINDKILYSLLKNFDISNVNLKRKMFWFFGTIKSRKILLFFEQSLNYEDKELMDKIIAILLEIGSIDGYLLLLEKFSHLKLDFKIKILDKINTSILKIQTVYYELTPEGIYQYESVLYSLINLLKNEKEVKLRIKIVELLGKIGLKKIEPLLEIINDENVDLRAKTVEALGKIRDRKGFRPLILHLDDESKKVRIKAIEALGELNNPLAVAPLIKKLKDQDFDIIKNAIDSLGKLRDENAIDSLIPLLNHSKLEIKLKTLEALGEIDGSYALSEIVKKLDDKNQIIRAKAAEVLGIIGDDNATEFLLKKLNDLTSVKLEVIRALGILRTSKALEKLISILPNEPNNVKKEILIALGKIKDRKAIQYILEQIKIKDLRGTIIWALSEIEDDLQIKYLLKKLLKKDIDSKIEVINEIIQLDSDKIIPPLIILMNDSNKEIANRANEILNEKNRF
ncbi:MAG: HEAT repeat domain-containing protein [Candidatus Helarchaeota archaeon]